MAMDDQAFGQFLHNILNPAPEPGPPYVWVMETGEDGKPFLRLTNPDED